MGEIESILGIKIQRDKAARTITLSQHSFIEEACEKFQVHSYEPVTNPVNRGIDVNINTDTSRRLSTFEAKKFRSLVGTVNWLSLWTFPEVAYSELLGCFLSSPKIPLVDRRQGCCSRRPSQTDCIYADADFCSERH